MKQALINHFKNIPGWRTNRKLVIFSVDDYGNIRLGSKEAFDEFKKVKLPFLSHFDQLDTLETREDLEALFEVLDSVKDKNGNPALFTPFALPCNIDFEAMEKNNYSKYEYELLPKTYEKLALIDVEAYQGTWKLWNEGIDKKLMRPQFHGREHFNLHIFNDLLKHKDKDLLNVLKHKSYISIPAHKNYANGWTASYSFHEIEETEGYMRNVKEGLNYFKEVYGYEANTFTPPAQQFPFHLERELSSLGIKYIDCPRSLERHLGNGRYELEKHKLGGGSDVIELVRNVVFEPTTPRISNWVDFTFKQVEAAFRMKKPANISSHRVNFCGHIDSENRKKSLSQLKQLLQRIVKRWPDVEFISADELGGIISNDKK